MAKQDKDRCCLCGKVMDDGDSTARIEIGTKKAGRGGFKSAKLWGDCHEACLNQALPTARAAMNELQRLSKAAVKPGSKPKVAKSKLVTKMAKVAKIVVKKRKAV